MSEISEVLLTERERKQSTDTVLFPGAHEMNIAAASTETCSLQISGAGRQTGARGISVGVERIRLVPVLSRKKGKAMETLEIILGLFSKVEDCLLLWKDGERVEETQSFCGDR